MSYLTILGAVWAICAFFVVMFVRGATMHTEKLVPIPIENGERTLGKHNDLSRIV
jgi:hypothetical protein